MSNLSEIERAAYNFICNEKCFCSIQEVEQAINTPREATISILIRLEKLGLLKDVQHLHEDYPVMFRA